MSRRGLWHRRAMLFVASLAVVLLIGCGGGGRSAATRHDPAAPVYPSCGTAGFKRASAHIVVTKGVRRWQIEYMSTKPRSKPGVATVITLIEAPPRRAEQLVGGHTERIAGRRVSVLPANAHTRISAAQWATARAYYGVVTDGYNLRLIRTLVGCLP